MRLLPLLLIISCISQTQPDLPTIEEKYQIMEQIILDSSNNIFKRPFFFSDKSLLGPPIYPTPSERYYLTELLNIQDSTYLIEQFKGRRTLNSANFKSVQIRVLRTSDLEIEDFWKLVNSDSIGGLYSIEHPIFNEDRTKFFIRTGYLCGNLCGGQDDYLFQLNEQTGNWEIAEQLGAAVY